MSGGSKHRLSEAVARERLKFWQARLAAVLAEKRAETRQPKPAKPAKPLTPAQLRTATRRERQARLAALREARP